MVNVGIALSCALAALLVTAMITDARERRIPNWLNGAIALIAPALWIVHAVPVWPDIAIQFGIALGMLALLSILMQAGQMGGGDVKMIAALALVFSPGDFVLMLIGMAAIGGIMTAGVLVHHRLRTPDAPFENPYGIAIALGALLVLGEWYQLIPTIDILRVVFLVSVMLSACALAFVTVLRIRRRSEARRTIS